MADSATLMAAAPSTRCEREDGLHSHQRGSQFERIEQTYEVRGELGIGLRGDAGGQQDVQHVAFGDTAARRDVARGQHRRRALRHEIAGAPGSAPIGAPRPSARWWRALAQVSPVSIGKSDKRWLRICSNPLSSAPV